MAPTTSEDQHRGGIHRSEQEQAEGYAKGQDTPAADAADNSLIKLILETLNQHAEALHIITQRVLALDEQLGKVQPKIQQKPPPVTPHVDQVLSPAEAHQHGLQLFQQGQFQPAVRLFTQVLDAEETSECWNDWAAAQLACNRPTAAERGYRRALALNPENAQATFNLGVLLASQGQAEEAIPLLEEAAQAAAQEQRATILHLLADCRQKTRSRSNK